MTHRFLASALVVLSLVAAPAAASTLPPQSPPAATAAAGGLAIDAVRDWLISKGLEVGEVQRDGDSTMISVNDGGVTWWIFFFACEADVCRGMEFHARFNVEALTPAMTNGWNLVSRFVKAGYNPEQPTMSLLSYNLLLVDGAGADQLANPVSVWVSDIRRFLTHVGVLDSSGAVVGAEAE